MSKRVLVRRGSVVSTRTMRQIPVVEGYYPERKQRPLTRGDCENGVRPCPYVSCRMHLYLDVLPTGSVRLNFPKIHPDELHKMPETCALDVADKGGQTLEEAGTYLNVTRERARQMEETAKAKLEEQAHNLMEGTNGHPPTER